MTKSQNTKNEQQKDVALTALLAEYGKLAKELQDEKEKHMTRPSLRSPADEVVIEKQVWESTLNRSMALEAENAQLKELLKECKERLMSSNYENMVQYHEVLDIRDKINKIIGEK